MTRNVKELLVQLVGVRSLAIYFLDEEQQRLSPITSEGVDLGTLPAVKLQDGAASDPVGAILERTVLTGIAHVADGEIASRPAACIPMQLDDRVVGAIVVYSLLEQKRRFVTVDRELFKLLGAHARRDARRRSSLVGRRRPAPPTRGPARAVRVVNLSRTMPKHYNA